MDSGECELWTYSAFRPPHHGGVRLPHASISFHEKLSYPDVCTILYPYLPHVDPIPDGPHRHDSHCQQRMDFPTDLSQGLEGILAQVLAQLVGCLEHSQSTPPKKDKKGRLFIGKPWEMGIWSENVHFSPNKAPKVQKSRRRPAKFLSRAIPSPSNIVSADCRRCHAK